MVSGRVGMTTAELSITLHGLRRMAQRGIRREALALAVQYGRRIRQRGAWAFFIGRKEVRRWRRVGIDLSRCRNLIAIIGLDRAVITAYRNDDFRHLR